MIRLYKCQVLADTGVGVMSSVPETIHRKDGRHGIFIHSGNGQIAVALEAQWPGHGHDQTELALFRSFPREVELRNVRWLEGGCGRWAGWLVPALRRLPADPELPLRCLHLQLLPPYLPVSDLNRRYSRASLLSFDLNHPRSWLAERQNKRIQ